MRLPTSREIIVMMHEAITEPVNGSAGWAKKAFELSSSLLKASIERGSKDDVERLLSVNVACDYKLIGPILELLSLSPEEAILRYEGSRVQHAIAMYVVNENHAGDVTKAISGSGARLRAAILMHIAP